MRQLFILVIVSVSALLASCGGGNSPLALRAVSKTMLDENDLVIRSMPRSLHWINDSLAAMQIKNNIVIYNVRTGKIHNQYSGPKLNTDSLVTQTHKKFWPAFQELVPLTDNITKDPNLASRIMSFTFANGNFYCYYYATCQYKYTNINAAVDFFKDAHSDNPEQLQSMIRDSNLLRNMINVTFMDYVIVTDLDFKTKSIIPVYGDQFPKTRYGHYAGLFEFGFTVNDQSIYLMAVNQESPFSQMDTMLVTDKDSLTLLGKINLENDSLYWAEEVLNTHHLSGYRSTGYEYMSFYKTVRFMGDTLLVMTQYGLCDAARHARWRIQPALQDTEIVCGTYEAFSDALVYTVSHKPANMFDTKSTWTSLRLSDASGKIVSDTLLKLAPQFSRRNDTLLCISKDREHYYFEKYVVR